MGAPVAFWAVYGLALGAVVVALVGDMAGSDRLTRYGVSALLLAAGAVGLSAAWALETPLTAAQGAFVVGKGYSLVPGLIFALAAVSVAALGRDRHPGQAAALIALSGIGGSLAATSTDLITLLIGIETAAVCAYALVARGEGPEAAESALKYFVQGSVATGLLLLGLAFGVGLFAVDAKVLSVVAGMGEAPGRGLAISLTALSLVTAVAFKAGAAPFHSWAPDAYENATPPGAAFLAGPAKFAMVAALIGVTVPFASVGGTAALPYGELLFEVFGTLGVLAVLSIVVGSTVALTTGSYRRMLGYAGVAQVGYALVALASLGPSAALVFTATYAIGTVVAFLAAEYFESALPEWDGSIKGLAGLGRCHPAVAGALTVALMSLAGIPPLLGFWGKFQAFGAAVNAAASFAGTGETGFAAMLMAQAVAGIVGSVVSVSYYGGVIRTLFFDAVPARADHVGSDVTETESRAEGSSTGVRSSGVLVVGGAALLVVLGIVPAILGYGVVLQGFLLN